MENMASSHPSNNVKYGKIGILSFTVNLKATVVKISVSTMPMRSFRSVGDRTKHVNPTREQPRFGTTITQHQKFGLRLMCSSILNSGLLLIASACNIQQRVLRERCAHIGGRVGIVARRGGYGRCCAVPQQHARCRTTGMVA